MRMKNFNKLLAAGTTLAVAGLALTGCGSKSSSGSSKQVLNWNEASELPTMDLSKATDTISFDMLNNSMEGLLRIGKNSKVEPGIAKSCKVSSDGLTYTFNLRKNAKWSNGDNVTCLKALRTSMISRPARKLLQRLASRPSVNTKSSLL